MREAVGFELRAASREPQDAKLYKDIHFINDPTLNLKL